MFDESVKARMGSALAEVSPVHALISFAESLKEEGMSQREMYQLFDEYRVKHHGDVDETKYNAILDTMDIICGWCSPQNRLFDSELET